ncbi:MAG: SAM-dependent methyltransferase, partial [Actinobacteria bacterium]|nr:SAM-dependent methyltransferase [Actinomycetota bacterium]
MASPGSTRVALCHRPALTASTPEPEGRPKVVVVGLGPAGLELTPPGSIEALRSAPRSFARTANHLAAQQLSADPAFGSLSFFDHLYQSERSFEEVYTAIAETLVAAASAAGSVAYAVPGSPLVLERTVELLREDPRVEA